MNEIDIQIFIVFHKYIFDECYKNIPDDILYKYFTFYAVNPIIEKHYTSNKYKIINEWKLPIYDKTFQERGYNENSAIYHVYANNLHKDFKYIGFFQYDMKFNNNIIEFLQENIKEIPRVYSLGCYSFNFCNYETWNEQETLKYIINDYVKYNKTEVTNRDNYPLYNSYVMPKETYEKIMRWVVQLYDKLYPWCVEPPNATHYAHIGGIYERIMAFGIGAENLENIVLNVSHDHKYKAVSY